MPDIYGDPLLSETHGAVDSCERCGAEIPTPENVGMRIYENDGDGWEQLCDDCSSGWSALTNARTGEEITP